MSEANTTQTTEGSATQTDDKQTTEGTNATTTDTSTANNEGTQTPKTFTQEQLNAVLAKEKRDWEKKVKDAEAKAKLSDDEKLKADLAEAQSQLRERDQRDFVQTESKKAGVNNPALFYKGYKSDLTFDDKGNVTNLKEVIELAKSDSPELFGKANLGSIDGGSGKTPGKVLSRADVEKMSPAEINARWDEVSQFLTSQK